MSETTDLVVAEERGLADPADITNRAYQVAGALGPLIKRHNLFVNIQGNNYVKCEGWTTLARLENVSPREKRVTRLEDGSYEAEVELVDRATGIVVGGASAVCGMDETTWARRPEYARRSMAITRATGKACRLSYSWIMALCGDYEVTPFEEMPAELSNPEPPSAPPPAASAAVSTVTSQAQQPSTGPPAADGGSPFELSMEQSEPPRQPYRSDDDPYKKRRPPQGPAERSPYLAQPEGNGPVCSWGKYKGTPMKELPSDYLKWAEKNMDNAKYKALVVAEIARRS